MPKVPRPVSSIITSFTEARYLSRFFWAFSSTYFLIRHRLDLEVQEKRLGKLKDEKQARRQKRIEYLSKAAPTAKQQKKAEAKSAANSEKFRSMVTSHTLLRKILNRFLR